MKRVLLPVFLVSSLLAAQAQDCTDLFISEYIEGTGNNKALEIYNPTNAPINLDNYRLIRWDNGSTPPVGIDISQTDPTKVMDLPNVNLGSFDVYVAALFVTDPGELGGISDTALGSRADISISTCNVGGSTSRTICFNGDDAVELQKFNGSEWVSVDIFGSIGERPTNFNGTNSPTGGWTAVAPFSAPPPGFQGYYPDLYWSQDRILTRKPTVKKGVNVNPPINSFNASVEWDSVWFDTGVWGDTVYFGLGAHMCDCSSLSAESPLLQEHHVMLFPNPTQSELNVQAVYGIQHIRIISLTGSVVYEKAISGNPKFVSTSVENFIKGVYFAEIRLENGQEITHKFIKN